MVACRELLAQAEKGNYKLFVAHDADPGGYSIAVTIREETDRMPGYSVGVVDIGLMVQDALDMDLETETFTRKKALAEKLVLNDVENEWSTGEYVGVRDGKKTWVARRCELNALSSPQFVEFIRQRLEESRTTDKVVPPKAVIRRRALQTLTPYTRSTVKEMVERAIDMDGIVESVLEKYGSVQH